MTAAFPLRAEYAMIYQSEMDFVSRWMLDSPDRETGGQLFGFWTAAGVPVVLYAIGPGPKVNHQAMFFEQDMDYLTSVGRLLRRRYGLNHIGEWHSHHRLGLAQPSAHDAATMSSSVEGLGLGRFLMGLGNIVEDKTVFNAFEFVQGYGAQYSHLPWEIKAGISPFRVAIEADAELKRLLVVPQTVVANHGANTVILMEGQDDV